LVIHVGVSRDTKINIEICSYNKAYTKCDINEKCPQDECCIGDGQDMLSTKLNANKICDAANQVFLANNSETQCKPSVDPGRYFINLI
jgi:hypothetical protein